MKLAIILTYHNRIKKTSKALVSLLESLKTHINIEPFFFACDDGSTDGTSNMIKALIPNANIVYGNGDLYWAKGMGKALVEAEKIKPDFYLMINDDVNFYKNSIEIMFSSYEKHRNNNILAITGATESINGSYTYGGSKFDKGSGFRHKYNRSELGEKCDYANWNCFLISYADYNKIGRIDTYYEHSYADYDYSKRISEANGNIFVSDKFVGICERNEIKGTWQDKNLNPKERIKLLHKKNGLPIKSQFHYYFKFHKLTCVYWILKPYLVIFKDFCINTNNKKRIIDEN